MHPILDFQPKNKRRFPVDFNAKPDTKNTCFIFTAAAVGMWTIVKSGSLIPEQSVCV